MKYFTKSGPDILPTDCNCLNSAKRTAAARAWWEYGPAFVLDENGTILAVRDDQFSQWREPKKEELSNGR